MKFFRFKRRLKIKKEQYSLSEYLYDHECMYIGKDGFRLYKVIKSDILYEHYALDIDRLLLLSGFYKDDFDSIIKPIILRFIKKVGVVPASELHHDANLGGLIRHSLNVASQALKIAKELMLFRELTSSTSLIASLVVLSLAHDFGKILTDFEVYSLDRLHKWQSSYEDLDDFCQKHELSYISLHFISGRHHQHQELISTSLAMLVKTTDAIFSLINKQFDFFRLEDAFDGKLFEIVFKADMQAVKLYGSVAQSLLYVPDFIQAKLICDIYSGDKSFNQIDSDIFLTPFGVILECGSESFNIFKSFYENIVLGKRTDRFNLERQNFTQSLRTLGVFSAFGTMRVYNYYRIQIGEDLIYVKGALIALEDLKDYGECVNTVMLGNRMLGILEAISGIKQIENDKIVHIRVKGGALLNTITTENLDLSSIRCYESGQNQDFLFYEREFMQESAEPFQNELDFQEQNIQEKKQVSKSKLDPSYKFQNEILKFDLNNSAKHTFQNQYYPRCLLNCDFVRSEK